jgi:uncharacterized protein
VTRTSLLLTTWLALATSAAWPVAQSARTVDSVAAGDEREEAAHAYSGSNATSGESAGRTWRQATGSFSYTLKTYDDSPLAIVCIVADAEGTPEAFDILVDGKSAGRIVRPAPDARPGELVARPRFEDTRGRTAVVVSIEAHPGARTPRVLEVRTVQEHLE